MDGVIEVELTSAFIEGRSVQPRAMMLTRCSAHHPARTSVHSCTLGGRWNGVHSWGRWTGVHCSAPSLPSAMLPPFPPSAFKYTGGSASVLRVHPSRSCHVAHAFCTSSPGCGTKLDLNLTSPWCSNIPARVHFDMAGLESDDVINIDRTSA